MPRPGEWQHKWRQLKARKSQLEKDIAKAEKDIRAEVKGATFKLAPLQSQLRQVQAEINKILEANA